MFGLKNAPTEYQKIMTRIFTGVEGVIVFLDDIIVFGVTKEIHDQRLKEVLKILREFNFCLNHGKCLFGVSELEFLGWHISEEGISPTVEKIEAIRNFREPESVEEVRSFLGLVNFVGHCIPDLSTKTSPLRRLLKKGVTFKWSTEEREAFEELREILCNGSVLGYFNPDDDTVLIVDASPVGLGAVLIQLDKEKERVISFASKSLSEVERRYCQTEREALGIVFGIERFKYYLFGRAFWLYTDCKPLEFLFSERSKPCARIERWVMRVQSFQFKVCYKPGSMNIADSLSRLLKLNKEGLIDKSVEHSLWQIVEYSRPIAIKCEELKEESSKDPELIKVKSALDEGDWNDISVEYKVIEPELCWVDGVLLRGYKIVIPRSLRQRALELAHESHQGIVAMKGRLRSKVWWPGIDKEVEMFVKKCKECLLVSLPNKPEPLNPTKFPINAWEAIALDFKGPLPSGEYLLVVVDYYSKFTLIEVLKSITASNLSACLRKMFASFGPPVSIRADNGSQINCEEFKAFCREFDIKLVFSTPYWPQANGEVERMNRTIGKRLQISRLNKADWEKDLQTFLLNYHATPHSTTGKTPSELMMKRKIRDKVPHIEEVVDGDDGEVRDQVLKKKYKMKEYIDGKRGAEESDIQEGDEVVLWNMKKKTKLDSNFTPEEHVVVNKKGGEISVMSKADGSTKKRKVTHAKKIGNKVHQEKQREIQEKQQQDKHETQHEEPQSQEPVRKPEDNIEASSSKAEEPRPKRNIKVPSRFLN